MIATPGPGFYGKVPGLGDFVSRRLPRSFIDYWDEWLQTVIAASRVALGENWLATYLSSPLWRFVLSGGHSGAQPWAGVLMPSVDRVGRYFPLTIAASLPAAANPFAVIANSTQWFEQAEGLALSSLEADSFDMERFNSGVESLGAVAPDTPVPPPDAGDSLSRAGLQVPLSAANRVADGYAGMLQALVSDRAVAFSLWTTEGSDLVEPGLLMCDGLPTAHSYAALLDGQWGQWSWGSLAGAAEATDAAGDSGMEELP